jgi:hypothetical protein
MLSGGRSIGRGPEYPLTQKADSRDAVIPSAARDLVIAAKIPRYARDDRLMRKTFNIILPGLLAFGLEWQVRRAVSRVHDREYWPKSRGLPHRVDGLRAAVA